MQRGGERVTCRDLPGVRSQVYRGKNAMNLFDAIRGRRSVRNYDRRAIPDNIIVDCVDAARWAPFSSGKHYPLRFIVIRDAATKGAVRKTVGDPEIHDFLADAGAMICIATDTRLGGDDSDAHAAMANLLLTAYARGLGSCWIANYDRERLRALLGMPAGVNPSCLVAIGYATEFPPAPPRPPVDDLLMKDKWEGK